MQLNFQSIAYELARGGIPNSVLASTDSMVFDHALIYDAQQGGELSRVQDGCILVTDCGSLPQDPRWLAEKSIGLVVRGQLSEAYASTAGNAMAIESDVSLVTAANRISELIRAFQQECLAYLSCFYQKRSLWTLLQAALPRFENPLYVHDAHYCMLAYAENRTSDAMAWEYDFYSQGRLSASTIRGLLNSPRFAETFSTDGPRFYLKDEKIEDFDYLYMNLRKEGEYIGRIFVDQRTRAICPLDYARLAFIGRLAEQALVDSAFSINEKASSATEYLTLLLEAGTLDEDDLDLLLTSLNCKREVSFACISAAPGTMAGTEETDNRLCAVMRVNIPGSIAFNFRQRVVTLCLFDQKSPLSPQYEAMASIASSIAKDHSLRMGISGMGSDILDLSVLFKEAQGALDFTAKSGGQTLRFPDIRLSYLMRHPINTLPLQMVCPESLWALKRYDDENKSDFVHTLRVYLESDCSPAKATKSLFVHRSTLVYRIERIRSIMGDDFEAPEKRLLYLLALFLLEQ